MVSGHVVLQHFTLILLLRKKVSDKNFCDETERSSYILYRDADAGLEDKGQLFGRHDFHPVEGAYHQPEVKLLYILLPIFLNTP